MVSVLSESDTSEIETCRPVFEEEAGEDVEDVALETDLRRFCGEPVCWVTHLLDVMFVSFDFLQCIGVTGQSAVIDEFECLGDWIRLTVYQLA